MSEEHGAVAEHGGDGLTATSYIQHHLQNLCFGQLPAGYVRHGAEGEERLESATWTLAHTAQ